MTAFVTRTSTHYGVDRILTSVTVQALYQNLFAAFEGDATAIAAGLQLATAAIAAGAVTQAKLGNSSVGQAQLKTTTAAGSLNLLSTAAGSYALTGGTYSLWQGSADNGAVPSQVIAWGNGNVAAGNIGVVNSDPVGGGFALNFYVDERYVQASPPYNLGNGDIPLFVFLLMSGATIRGISIGADPTWAYHGPTDIRPTMIDESGREFNEILTVDGVPFNSAILDKGTLSKILTRDADIRVVPREITHAVKNADMGICPHPWYANTLPPGESVILLDPLSPLVDRLALVSSQAGARMVRDMIMAGDVLFDNQPLGASCPPGVTAVRARLR